MNISEKDKIYIQNNCSNKNRVFSTEDDIFIKEKYPEIGLIETAKILKRTINSVRSRASFLNVKSRFKFNPIANSTRGGWKGKKRPAQSKWMKDNADIMKSPEARKKLSISSKKRMAEMKKKGIPFTLPNQKGYKHTEETKKKMSDSSKKMWANPNSKLNSIEYRQKVSDRMSVFQQNNIHPNRYSKSIKSWETIGNKRYFFRSSWEVLYARYLQFLIEKKEIKQWLYEPETFWFEKIKRGVRSYKPDFKITNNNDSIEYHEVKGWMDAKSKTKLARMGKYYPDIKIIVIDSSAIKEIKKWERLYQ